MFKYVHVYKHTPPYTTHQITLALMICHELELRGLHVDSCVTAPPSCCWLQGRAYSTCFSCAACLPPGSMGSFPYVYLLKLLKYFITCCFQNNTDEVIQATILPALKTNCFEQAVKW